MSLNNTPRSNRLHIGIYGKRNSGKSSLVNAITGTETALVSDYAGTTTDPVYKAMEIYGIGPCVFIDTAGFDDEGEIGALRVKKTKEAVSRTDVALVVFDGSKDIEKEKEWIETLKKKGIPTVAVLNKSDLLNDIEDISNYIEKETGIEPIVVSAKEKSGIEQIRGAILRNLPEDYDAQSITGGIVKNGDLVLLVMPQDIQAPKGRLILPQVQTLRELLDKKCLVLSVTTDQLDRALESLAQPPDVIITDSQVFKTVYEKKPKESKLTSFSVLFAGYKGDIEYFTESVAAIENLTEDSRVLIAEACTHVPLSEDIGREQLPRLLRQKIGENLKIDIVSGPNFPGDVSSYDLIIHCGGCMFNRKYVLSRIEKAAEHNIPMTNYGIVIAYLSGILDKISIN
ncbi:[FeFe] hydrogenase H-cluster maturation GTPase HydF [Defluviitalea saccharophila]|uniref:[FeFe] hydrogenase H-cluster maturation GTPase HydF n=1 Tax=Defluviitalea saccharophila TaxID=879970 RepID=A0ABZ2Y6R3_9FIRM